MRRTVHARGMSAATTKRSFAPVVDRHTRLLVIGSLPGDRSLRDGQYYAHPRNQFWRLLEPVVGAALADAAYPTRLARLQAAGVGLWDVIGAARREGSLDADIRDGRHNDLRTLVDSLPALRAVAFNGATAATLGRRQLGGIVGLALVALPSSSPAYTAALAIKQAHWSRLRRFLADPPGD